MIPSTLRSRLAPSRKADDAPSSARRGTGPQGSASLEGRCPAPPRRRLLRAVGALLIVAGVTAAGSAWWEEWGTGIQTAAAQDDLEDDFAEIMAASTRNETIVPLVTAPEKPSAPPSSPSGVTAPSTVPDAAPANTAPAPTTTAVPTLPLNEGDVLGRIEIPAIGVDWIAVHGVRTEDIDRGPGHFPGTPLPGEPGNSAFAGHRTTHGAPFYRIDELVDGDSIFVTTPAGRFEYRVFDQMIVDATDTWVIETGDPDVAVLTLISCHPKRSTAQRIVVNAILIDS